MKITVVGGGSTYTPELVNGFLARAESLPISELCLMDINPQRLEVVGGFIRRLAAAQGQPFDIRLSTDRREAIQGAAYVITQLRVGQMQSRRADEYLGQRHGLIGQETTGVGGMAKALRTIPVILDIAAEIRELAPGALLVNFTNPAGLLTEALQRYASEVASAGVCNVPITAKMNFLEVLGISVTPEQAELDTLGLNHLTWHRGLTLEGEDLWPRLMEVYLAQIKASPDPEWDVPLIETLGMVPNYYLHYYYYTDRKLAEQNGWPPSRAEVVMQVEQDLLRQYADPTMDVMPADLMKRGGAYYSTVATQLINAHYNDLGEVHIVNTRHHGSVPGLPVDWVLEMPCRVDKAGIHPLPAGPLPVVCSGLIAQVKAYELLTMEAAVHGDRGLLYQALLAHPLGPKADQVEAVLNDLLETNKAYLPQFSKRER